MSSRPAFRRGSIACAGAAFTPASCSRSASPGFSTGSRCTLAGALSRRAEGKPDAAVFEFRRRACQQRLSRRRRARRARLRLAHRPDRAARNCSSSRSRSISTATAATALSWNVASFALFRFLTGAGIGGEYTAINSTIQELVPARYRGWTDLVINGSFWIGAAIGAVAAIVLLDPALFAPDHRLAARLSHRREPRPRSCS